MGEAEEKKKIVQELMQEAGIKAEEINQENPYKKLHYATLHLPVFHEFSNLTGLYGRHYIPLLKARWYQLFGGIIQRSIRFARTITDTRLHVVYPLVTEGGKNEIIYSIKELVKAGIDKGNGELFTIAQPTSFHPEQLIGKFIEIKKKVLNEKTNKYRTETQRIENRGHLNNDFLEFDECNQLITSTKNEDKQARETLSISENPIGRNEVEKRLTEDTPENVVRYCPRSTNSYYFQPYKKLPEETFLQGFLRRKLIPMGSVGSFLNLPTEEMYNYKVSEVDFSREDYSNRVINYLERVKEFSDKGLDIVFDNEAIELIKKYALYISQQGQIHSEKIRNYCMLSKFTSLDYLIKMSAIISCAYFKQVVDKNAVCLAYMDLVELMQNTYDFIFQKTVGDFDYGTKWGGADFKQRECLKLLYETKSFSKEKSQVSIEDFIEIVMKVYDKSDRQARRLYLLMKKENLIDSSQIGQYGSAVWLKFNPKQHNNYIQAGQGGQGFLTYNYVFEHLNHILGAVNPDSPDNPQKIK